jgi:hypothetical protein
MRGQDISTIYSGENEEQITSLFDSLKLTQKQWKYMDNIYKIIKYDKEYLCFDSVLTSGLFRSVIHKNGKILSFSPPKSMSVDRFTTEYNPEECSAEEFVEGTMINLFFDDTIGEDGQWEISTKSSVGAKMTYFTSGKVDESNTFRTMFLDVCNHAGLDFDILPRENCYTFVFQHPQNRIVIPFNDKRLYLVAAYKIDNSSYIVTEVLLSSLKKYLTPCTDIFFPESYGFDSFSDLKERWASSSTDYKSVGVMMRHRSGVRSKFRNPNYEMVRKLRGNQPKLQFRYIALKQQGQVKEYLKYFPESSTEFNSFREQIHSFTKQLHENYIGCYMKKNMPLTDYPYQFRTHMFNIHKKYIEELRPANSFVNKAVVIEYVNTLPPARLMYSLNYMMRQIQHEETIVLEQRSED